MKQILPLALALLPCLAWAQYPSNGNQKITLGEQTTADGLIWRGVAADTTLTAKSDTTAYFVLDTVNINLYTYKASATGRKWRQLGADTASIAYVNTYGTQTVNGAKTFTSAVTATRFNPTANTATGTGMYAPNSTSLGYSINGIEEYRVVENGTVLFGNTASPNATQAAVRGIHIENKNQAATMQMIGLRNNVDGGYIGLWKARGEDYNITNLSSKYALNGDYPGRIQFGGYKFGAWRLGAEINVRYDSVANGNLPSTIIFRTGLVDMSDRMHIRHDGEVWIGYTSDNGAYPLQVNGQIFATNATIATSDVKFKENITPLNKGLEIVNKLKPVTFNFINNTENNFSEYEEVGFIAQDVDRALSTETFAKSIVKAADDSEPNSTMGLATQNLIPLLVKAIQEQNQLIKALEQRIINLENK